MGKQENLDKREGALADELGHLAHAIVSLPDIPTRLREASERIKFLQEKLGQAREIADQKIGAFNEARHAADRYRRALRVIVAKDTYPTSYRGVPETLRGRYALIALEALGELEKIKPSTADALVEEFGSKADVAEKSTDEASAMPNWPHRPLTPLDRDLSHPVIKVILEGVDARENGTNCPYPGNTLEHSLHAFGWVQRDLRLAFDACKAREKHDPELRKVAGELLTMIDTVQTRRMPGMSASHGIYSPGSPMAGKVEELRKLVNAEPAKS